VIVYDDALVGALVEDELGGGAGAANATIRRRANPMKGLNIIMI